MATKAAHLSVQSTLRIKPRPDQEEDLNPFRIAMHQFDLAAEKLSGDGHRDRLHTLAGVNLSPWKRDRRHLYALAAG